MNEDYDLLLQGLVLQSLHSIYERAGRGLRTRRRTQLLQFRINIHGIQAVWVGNVQGVPKKSVISVEMLLEAFKNELQIKVG